MRRAVALAFLTGVSLIVAGCKLMPSVTVNTQGRIQADIPPVLDRGPMLRMPVDGAKFDPDAPTIALIDVDGLLLNFNFTGFGTFAENPVSLFREKLDAAASDNCVRGVVLRINTPGGGVTATDVMWHELQNFRARTGLPVVACLMDTAAGGGYYLASGTDHIVAHPTSVTGGIGVILNLYNLEDTMLQFNISERFVRSGENIDLGSPTKPMTEEDRQLLQSMADEFHARFRHVVTTGRPALSGAAEELFDGRVFTAHQAVQAGLIDQVGYLDDAVATAKASAGITHARVVLYHRCGDRARTPYAMTPNTPLQGLLMPFSIPGLDRSRMPTFLYLWQADPAVERYSGR